MRVFIAVVVVSSHIRDMVVRVLLHLVGLHQFIKNLFLDIVIVWSLCSLSIIQILNLSCFSAAFFEISFLWGLAITAISSLIFAIVKLKVIDLIFNTIKPQVFHQVDLSIRLLDLLIWNRVSLGSNRVEPFTFLKTTHSSLQNIGQGKNFAMGIQWWLGIALRGNSLEFLCILILSFHILHFPASHTLERSSVSVIFIRVIFEIDLSFQIKALLLFLPSRITFICKIRFFFASEFLVGHIVLIGI